MSCPEIALQKQINVVYKKLIEWFPAAIELVGNSFLNNKNKQRYKALITQRISLFQQS